MIKKQNEAQTYLHLQSAIALEAKCNFLIAEVIRQGKRREGQLHTRYYQLKKSMLG